ncbi:3101_t:CDS:1, partial [Dentiscutata erythropus]
GDENGKGVIDIGSNGIRFGLVSSLSRHLPVIYEERAPISLFDAQHSGTERVGIPESVIVDVINSLKRFKLLSQQYKVNDVKVLATEATRTAPNSDDFRSRILKATNWDIDLLSKDDEAKISAKGIIATYYGVEGLVMDMGGGSVEINYVIHHPEEDSIEMSDSPINLPYGAAALSSLLSEANNPRKRHELFEKIKGDLEKSYKKLNPPKNIEDESGFKVYMSGGGLRALGYLCMSEFESEAGKSSENKAAYPVPIINGYGISAKELARITKRLIPDHDPSITKDKPTEKLFPNGNPFRISNRRANLIPAACFLLEAVMEVIPLRYVYFCEGGVRQGKCFDMMPESERKKDPLDTFISSHPLQPKYITNQYRNKLVGIIKAALPPVFYDILDSDDLVTETTTKKPRRLERLLPSLVYLSYWSMNLAKESRPIYAFYLPLAGGPLCNAPGITHVDRAIISWCLMYRHYSDSGDVEDDVSAIASAMFYSVKKMIPGGKDGRKVCEVIGKFLGFVTLCHPFNYEQNDEVSISNEPLIQFKVSEDDRDAKSEKKTYNIELNLMTKMEITENSSLQKSSLVNNPIVKKAYKKLEKSFSLGQKIKKDDKKNKKNGYHKSDINISVLI